MKKSQSISDSNRGINITAIVDKIEISSILKKLIPTFDEINKEILLSILDGTGDKEVLKKYKGLSKRELRLRKLLILDIIRENLSYETINREENECYIKLIKEKEVVYIHPGNVDKNTKQKIKTLNGKNGTLKVYDK